MGNCIVKEPSTYWGGDDWGCPSPVLSSAEAKKMEKQGSNYFLGENYKKKAGTNYKSLNAPFTATQIGETPELQVKIKITKKQLEELLSKVDLQQGKPVKDVLTQLLNLNSDDHGNETINPISSSWRPALQSIPEADVY